MKNGHRSGEIWNIPPRSRSQIVRRVCEELEKSYGKPRLGNPYDPIDDLVFIIISNKTSPQVSNRIYERIKKEFANWEELLSTPPSLLQSLLTPAGLSNVKTEQIYAALSKIKSDFNKCNLNQIVGKSESYIEEYLLSLPGVSEKVAKCVMMYTMGFEVLPVDSHVFRISKRLGWTSRNRADQCHGELEALIPTKRRFAFHVDCIMHGRLICRPREPDCIQCCVNHHCNYFSSQGVT